MLKARTSQEYFDHFKWTVVVLLLGAIVGANAYFSSTALTIRVTFMIVFGLIALFVALTTVKGKITWKFFQEARAELRKVVWPTRQETIQTTLMIAGIVFIMAMILWGVDSFFAYFVSTLLI
ncbi:MAG: preprotein translocase subunit SecE [Gammaproteobacteria bacterium]|nr:preprotein translocase subunit SecE [Gammaproteobacteria bacterium]